MDRGTNLYTEFRDKKENRETKLQQNSSVLTGVQGPA